MIACQSLTYGIRNEVLKTRSFWRFFDAYDLLTTYKYGWKTSYYQNTYDGKVEDEPMHPLTYEEAEIGSVNLQPNQQPNILLDTKEEIKVPQKEELSEEECEACNI